MNVLLITSQLPSGDASFDMAPLVRQIESLRRGGAEVEVLEVTGAKRWKYIGCLPKLRRMAARADLIHGHYAFCGWLARTRMRRPVVCSFMGDDLLGTPDAQGRTSLKSRIIVRASRLLARTVDAAIVKSAEMARIISTVPAHVIPNGVDLNTFAPLDRSLARERLGWRRDGIYVLFPGNPGNPRKGFDLAQQIMESAERRLTDTVDGPLNDAAGAREPIELKTLWGVEPTQVPLYMNACDAMLMTSWLEGSPNVVKEAMACNLPIVSVRVGDTPELLAGVDGCVLGPRDPRILGEYLCQVLITCRRSAGRAAIERLGLDTERVAQRIIGVYDRVLTTRTPANVARSRSQQQLDRSASPTSTPEPQRCVES